MIKTSKRVPQVYSKESRDFQLFGHLFDAAFNGSKVALDTILNNQGTEDLDYRFVDLMCKTIGFDYTGDYTTQELLYVIKSFKLLTKNKGSRQAIEQAIGLLLNSQGIKEPFFIPDADWNDSQKTGSDIKTLHIFLPDGTQNINLLDELFKYILPAGWQYTTITKTYKISEASYMTDIATSDSIRRKKTDDGSMLKDGINEVELGKSNYIKNNKVVSFENIGEVPTNETDDIISPVVNLGTVVTDNKQTEKYDK